MQRRLLLVTLVASIASFAAGLHAQREAALPQEQIRTADALFAGGEYQEAREAYTPLTASRDPEIGARASAGVVLSVLRTGDFQAAQRESESFRRARPGEALVAAVNGDALWAVGRFEDAEREYESALRLDPAQARAHHGRARSLSAIGRLPDALRAVREAVTLDPAEPEYYHTLASIHERQLNYAEAAEALREYLPLLPEKARRVKSGWVRGDIRFLESFKRRPPLQIEADDDSPASAEREEEWRVPIRVRRNKVLVKVRVNGAPQEFVLDTGAEQTVISRDLARVRGVAPVAFVQSAGVGDAGTRGLQLARIDTFEVGPLKIRNVPCLVRAAPIRGLPSRELDAFSPLALGLSMRIDYQKRELLMARQLPPADYRIELPMRLHRLAMVRGTLNGSLPASFVVDTGGEVISISDATASQITPIVPFRRIPLRVYGASGRDRDAFLMPNVDLDLGGVRLDRTPLVVLNLRAPSALLGFQVGGIVGHRFLSKYRVTIDLRRSVVGLDSY